MATIFPSTIERLAAVIAELPMISLSVESFELFDSVELVASFILFDSFELADSFILLDLFKFL